MTLVRSGFEAPVSVAADFRGLTPIVLTQALERAGTQVYEPYHAFELEIPADVLSDVAQRITALGARITETRADADRWRLTGTVPARRLDAVQRILPGLTRGEASGGRVPRPISRWLASAPERPRRMRRSSPGPRPS